MVSWKGSLPEGVVYEKPVIQLDVLPTVLAAAGVKVEPEWKLDGVNLLPYLKGEIAEPPHAALFWRLGEQTAVREGDWKLVRYDRIADETTGQSDPQSEAQGDPAPALQPGSRPRRERRSGGGSSRKGRSAASPLELVVRRAQRAALAAGSPGCRACVSVKLPALTVD